MKSIFDPATSNEFIDRLNQLTPSTRALWGKMNVSQMLSHCQVLLKMSLNELDAKRGLMAFLFGRMAKKKALSDQPFKHNLPTLGEAKITGVKDFDAEKQGLIQLIKRFEAGPAVLTSRQHAFFGPMTVEEWDKLQVKHLDHHLRQFGV